jgi:hypothetical protein
MRANEREYRVTDIYRKKAVLHSSSNVFYVCYLWVFVPNQVANTSQDMAIRRGRKIMGLAAKRVIVESVEARFPLVSPMPITNFRKPGLVGHENHYGRCTR